MGQPIRVYLVDDEKAFAEALSTNLGFQTKGQLTCVWETDGERAIEKIIEIKPDVVLLDLQMPKINGLVVGRRIKKRLPGCQIIALTKVDRPYQPIREALGAGFTGFLLKSTSINQIMAAIGRVLAGEIAIEPGLSHHLRDDRYEAIRRLTRSELEVLTMIEDGMSNHEIADKRSVTLETVKGQVSAILEKTGCRNRAELASYATRLQLTGLWSLLLDSDET